ncbi:MAG TPA: divalent-cation tolerance protein CutA [Burkholderiaceae bacterium]|nr:divalent-cation tolerance protein CutA [Burkholderiaceae bacterium]HNG79268.1 divalent-cation tolerance protein CutA [Burkholderiaceae bacterium]
MNATIQPGCLAVVTTVGQRADAQALARALVELRLAACAQISEIESVYHWDGALQQDAEWRVLFKTQRALYPAVEAAILARHPYSLPAIHAWALEPISAAYAAWIAAETLTPPGG